MRWYDWKRNYPDTSTHTTTDGTFATWCPSVQQSAATLPRNLKRLREARGLTPTQLARKAGVSASTVRGMEMPWRVADSSGLVNTPPNPTLMSMLAVAAALGVGIEVLVEEREP